MKKIALITPYFYPIIGGTQTVVINIAKQLKKRKYKIEIITPKVNKKSKTIDTYERIKIKRTKMIPNKILNEIWFQIETINYLKKFDIIHVFHPYFSISGLIAKKIYKKPLIINLIGWDNYNPLKKQPIIDKLVKYLTEKADITISASKDTIKRARKQGIKKEIQLIPHGINKINNKKEWGKKTKFLYVGRLAKIKNPMKLIKSWEKANTKNKELTIVGDGEIKEQIIQYIKTKKIKNIKVKGFITNKQLKKEYKKANILIHLPIYESFGLTIIEAMANKIPIIATKTGGIPEIITKKTGILVKNKKEIIKAIETPKKQIKEMAKYTTKEVKKYQWKNIIKQYIKIYKNI